MQVALPGPYRLTYQDWLRYPDDGQLYEIIEGELLVTPPPSIAHQRASRDIEFRILEFLKRTGAGEVFYAPIGVRLDDDTVLEPDIVVILEEHRARIGTQVIDGAPDLVIEVLSPGTARRDLGTKRAAYESHGVREYWIVDPETRSVEVLWLEQGSYARHGLFRVGDALTSRLLEGFSLVVAEVFG